MKEWEACLTRKQATFQESEKAELQRLREKEETIAQKLHTLDLKRADLEEAECQFKKVGGQIDVFLMG